MNNTQLSDHIRKFEEMEAAFQKNHDEIERASGRMDTLEDRITRTMSACEKLSSQVATMDSRFTSMFEKLEMLLIARIPTTQHTDPQEMILTQDNNSITDERNSNDADQLRRFNGLRYGNAPVSRIDN